MSRDRPRTSRLVRCAKCRLPNRVPWSATLAKCGRCGAWLPLGPRPEAVDAEPPARHRAERQEPKARPVAPARARAPAPRWLAVSFRVAVLAGAAALGLMVASFAFDGDQGFESPGERVAAAEPPAREPAFQPAGVRIPRSRLSVPTPLDIPVIRVSGEARDTSVQLTLISEVRATVTVKFMPGYASAQIPPNGTRQLALPAGCYRMTYSAHRYAPATDRECLSAGSHSIRFYLVRVFG